VEQKLSCIKNMLLKLKYDFTPSFLKMEKNETINFALLFLKVEKVEKVE
jgi:hypothetical protein